MPDNITVAFVQQYKANVELLLQQDGSRLTNAVDTGSFVGKAASVVEQFGSATAQLKTGRHADTPLLDLSQDKRWVHPADYEWGSLIDNEDRLRMLIDPTNAYVRAGSAAMNRAKDDVILAAMFATSKTGENGTTDESFGTLGSGTYDVGVDIGGTASALNVAKLQKAIRILMTANKGELMEPVWGAISSYEHDSLLKEIQIVNKDYNNSAVLVDGKISRFMGINFIITERLTITSGNRLVPVWLKSGMHLGMWNDLNAKISERADKSYAWQVYLCMTLGATRTQLGKIVRIQADDQI
jgi:hypothetical protein